MMASDTKPIPEGMSTVTPYMVVPDAVEAIAIYTKALGAELLMRMPGPGGQGTIHAEIRIGNSTVMLTDENPAWEMKSPASLGGSPVSLMVYVEDVDQIFEQATQAGFAVVVPVADMFWGDRMGKLTDPFGYQWSLATHVEDIDEKEMAKRQEAWMAELAKNGGECPNS